MININLSKRSLLAVGGVLFLSSCSPSTQPSADKSPGAPVATYATTPAGTPPLAAATPMPSLLPPDQYKIDVDTSNPSTDSQVPQWYVGGTLSKAGIEQWRSASSANRLATAADMVAAALKMEGRRPRDMSDFRAQSEALERCISEPARR